MVPPQRHSEASKPEELPNPPEPFVRAQDGLYKVVDGVPIKFHKYNLYPVKLTYDNESVVIRHWLPHNGWREFSIRSALFMRPVDCMMKLMDNSVQPLIGNMMVEYLRAYIQELRARAALRQESTNYGTCQPLQH
jgi:hypothetical protein